MRGKHAASAAKRRAEAESETVAKLRENYEGQISHLNDRIAGLEERLRLEGARMVREADPIVEKAVHQATASLRHEVKVRDDKIDAIRKLIFEKRIAIELDHYETLTGIFGPGWLDHNGTNRRARRARRRGMSHHLNEVHKAMTRGY